MAKRVSETTLEMDAKRVSVAEAKSESRFEDYHMDKNYKIFRLVGEEDRRPFLKGILERWADENEAIDGLGDWSTVYFCSKVIFKSYGSDKVLFCLCYSEADGTVKIARHKECPRIYFENAMQYLLYQLVEMGSDDTDV
jgi:hypothetical protein